MSEIEMINVWDASSGSGFDVVSVAPVFSRRSRTLVFGCLVIFENPRFSVFSLFTESYESLFNSFLGFVRARTTYK